jgi:hypothetical protein
MMNFDWAFGFGCGCWFSAFVAYLKLLQLKRKYEREE